MELDLNSKLIDFLNEEYKIDFNNFKLLRFCRSKDEQLIFLIECEDKYFFIECSYFYKDRIRFFYEVKPKKGKTIEYYCDSNKCNNVILEMKDEKIYYSFKIENKECNVTKYYSHSKYHTKLTNTIDGGENVLKSNVISMLAFLNV